MPKFYVQSGNVEMVLYAHDSRCAAIWAVHRTLSQSLPILCEEASDYAAAADFSRLGEAIAVSERGFDREDAACYDTLDILAEWNQLLVALDRLQERMNAGPGYAIDSQLPTEHCPTFGRSRLHEVFTRSSRAAARSDLGSGGIKGCGVCQEGQR